MCLLLSNWQKSIVDYIPPQITGYDYVSRIPVFIPIREMKLDILERRIQKLSLIQDCVLSLIDQRVQNISSLSDYLGVKESIMIQIIAQLDTERLVFISASSLKLTSTGKQALEQLQKEQIHQKQINRLYINSVTGEFSVHKPTFYYDEPYFGAVYLDETFELNLQYLRKRFDDIEKIYNDEQVEKIIFNRYNTVSAQLYRITDISDQKLKYIKEYCFVYANKEDRSLLFHFKSGNKLYNSVLLDQILERNSGAFKLLQRPDRNANESTDTESEPTSLIKAIQSRTPDIGYDIVEHEYYQDRALLDGELIDFIENHSSFTPQKLWIEAPYLCELFENNAHSFILSQNVEELVICYSENDKSARQIISTIKETVKRRDNLKLQIHQKSNIDSILVMIDDTCVLHGHYKAFKTMYGRTIFKSCSTISFDKARNAQTWESMQLPKAHNNTNHHKHKS